MAEEEEDEKMLSCVTMGRHKVYRFYDHDEYSVRFVHADHPERYILIQKQALAALASVVKGLADQFTK